jgi:hypothetical protein
MNFKHLKYFLYFLLLTAVPMVLAAGNGEKTKRLSKTAGEPVYTKMNINQISTWVKNDGESDISQLGNSGFEYPKNSGKTAVFQSGFLWGGKVDGQIRVGGSVYRQGLVPGKLLNSGVPWEQLQAEDPGASNVRIYRVRPDWSDGSVLAEINDGEGSESEIRAQYETDWNEWPAADGAPFEDLDSNGVYDPAIDVPGVPGASQTIWFVANDADEEQTEFMYGSLPMGIEMQATLWAYNQAGALGSMLFRRYKIINKSSKSFEDMYVSMWNDPDLGDASDDFVGCDTTLSMTFVYNANPVDATYGSQPAAAGFDFFQGPIVEGAPEDTAIFNNQYVIGKKNLPMTAHYFFINSDPIYTDPTQGVYTTGTIQWYNLLQGRVGSTGEIFPVPAAAGGGNTVFALAGDPVTQTGWVDGLQHPAGDRRAGMASGPFTMAPGDTQEVVVAEIAAIGTSNINSVSKLKDFDRVAQEAYDKFFVLASAPRTPRVDVVEMDEKVLLNWGNDQARVKQTESHNTENYKFEGYNVYQLKTASSSKDGVRGQDWVRIATYDVVNGVKVIIDKIVDPQSGQEVTESQQFGNDTGLERSILIDRNYLTNQPLNNGSRYYFAVTSYAYNDDERIVPNNLENPIAIITVVPHSTDPGEEFSTDVAAPVSNTNHSAGLADATVNVTVADPSKLTGHEYEVFFNEQEYILNSSNVWEKVGAGKLSKDVTGSALIPTAVYGEAKKSINVNLTLDLQSSTFAWVDGVKLVLPAGAVLMDAPTVHAGGGDVEAVVDGDTITYGLVNGEVTENGVFHGDEVISLVLGTFTPPLEIAYTIYDDGYDGDSVGFDPINAEGIATVTEVGNLRVMQNHWNLRDKTTGQVVLEDQTVLGGQDIYAADVYSEANGIAGPLGSTGSQFAGVGLGAGTPVVDGLLVNVEGSYDQPIEYNKITIEKAAEGNPGVGTGNSASRNNTIFANYTLYGLPTSWARDFNPTPAVFDLGTTDIDLLQQDYELRFTGVLDTLVTAINDTLNDTLITVRSGGQMATIFSTVAGAGGLANHRLNPSPGTAAPFLIRIPFEVWNKTTNTQINVSFRDREQQLTANPFRAWNSENRNYLILINTPYNESKVIPVDAPNEDNALATWAVVMYSTRAKLGDIITIQYNNPLQLGVDLFTFTAPGAATYNDEKAKSDVERINVFPNPYYGVNPQELNKYQRFVTLNHLPTKATIRIFNLAGQLVRTIEKNEVGQFQRWDLLTEDGLPVASGLYIIYVDMPELGKTKVLKAAIIQEQQILDRY